MKVNDLPVWEKPREKLLREGAGRLTNAEILAILLGTGSRVTPVLELAGEILTFDPDRGIRYLAECSPEDLRRFDGMGDAKVCVILAAVELGRRIARTHVEDHGRIRSSDDIAGLYMESLRYRTKEHFLCLLIDTRGRIIQETEVSVGDLDSSPANPREVFSEAIRRCASSVIFVHNHPSGDPSPSEADLGTTRRLIQVGELVGIPVLDHIIIGDGIHISMKAAGMI